MKAFPISSLKSIGLWEYVIGTGKDTFCAHVEAKTKGWANIVGATAYKFGVYHGKVAGDQRYILRASGKFGTTAQAAFKRVRQALLDLVKSAKTKDFAAIDANPLSQLFKAKIISLYFPKLYLNVCSGEHLDEFAEKLGLSDAEYCSEQQHALLKAKNKDPIAKSWTNTRFMRFLYWKYKPSKASFDGSSIQKPNEPKDGADVDFEDIDEQRRKIGRRSEKFALVWEKERLRGEGVAHLIPQIKDLTKKPKHGYDFRSFEKNGSMRYIEVKSILRLGEQHRLFLSAHEKRTSLSRKHSNRYYIYLVSYDGTGMPATLTAMRAPELYKKSSISPCAYILEFKLTH